MPGLIYLGVLQPRHQFDNHNAGLLVGIARGNVLPTQPQAEALHAALAQQIAAGKTLVLSEEMLLVGKDADAIRALLRRIAVFLDGLPTTLIVTLRDPAETIPSYYQQIFHSLPVDLALDFARFAANGRNFCYDYAALFDFIETLPLDLHLVDFDRIKSRLLFLSQFLGPHCHIEAPLSLSVLNVSHRNAGQDARSLPNVTLSRLSSLVIVDSAIKKFGLRRFRGWRLLAALARRISLRKSRFVSLEMDAVTRAHFAESYAQARQHLPGNPQYGT